MRLLSEHTPERKEKQEGIRPTVLIGLGGTGGDVLLKVRQKIYERYGHPADFPVVQSVYIDTDTSNQHIDTRLLDEFAFSPGERYDSVVPDTSKYTRHLNQYPRIKAWWYPSLHDLTNVTTGAGQIRAYSRLSFFVPENFQAIRNAISRAANDATAAMTETKMLEHGVEMDKDKGVNVYIVASLAGGTGGGMFLDVAFLCRTILRCKTMGFLVLPGIFPANMERIFGNGYSALKELEHYTFPGEGYSYEWDHGFPPRLPIAPPCYDYCYLIDSVNASSTSMDFNSRYSMFELVANNIFHDFGSSDFAAHKRSFRVNLEAFLNDYYVSEIKDPEDPRKALLSEAFTTRYSSFGMATIKYPVDRIRHACSAKLGADIMQRLARGKAPEINITAWVREEFMKQNVALFIGDLMVGGKPVRRHDILDALYESHETGRTLAAAVRDWISKLRNEVSAESYKGKGMTLSQFLQAKTDEQLVNFRDEKFDENDWRNWGDHIRTMHLNKMRYLNAQIIGGKDLDGQSTVSRFDSGVSQFVNDANKGIPFAKLFLKEMRRILTDDAFPYLPLFRREFSETQQRVTMLVRDYQAALNEIRTREIETGVSKLVFGSSTMEFLTGKFLRLLEQYFVALLKLRALKEAADICQSTLDHIGEESHIIDAKRKTYSEDTGLMRRIADLERCLEEMRRAFEFRKAEFIKPQEDVLALSLYEPKDVDDVYYPHYVGWDEATRLMRISESTVQVLDQLPSGGLQPGIRVMELPDFVAREGLDRAIKLMIRETTKMFATIASDFEVLELFFKRYPNEPDQLAQLSLLYSKAQPWISAAPATEFTMGSGQRVFCVGMYDDPNKPTVYKRFQNLLFDRVQKQGHPPIMVKTMTRKSEVIFYSEAAGFPLCSSRAVHDMRPTYDRLVLDRFQNLHADRNEYRFREILPLNEDERQRMEDGVGVFLSGVILGVIRVKDDDGEAVFYVEERVGLEPEPRFIGTEHRAVRAIARDQNLRSQLKSFIARREDELAAAGLLPRYYAVLSNYQRVLYPPLRFETAAKETQERATTENLVLRKKLREIEARAEDIDAFRLKAESEKEQFESGTIKLDGGRFRSIRHDWKSACAVSA